MTTRPCIQCAAMFIAAHPAAQTCSAACRNRLYRARLLAQRARLAAQAEAALASRDVAELTAVARRAAVLLAP